MASRGRLSSQHSANPRAKPENVGSSGVNPGVDSGHPGVEWGGMGSNRGPRGGGVEIAVIARDRVIAVIGDARSSKSFRNWDRLG
jgi:hypothetical protein